MIDQALVIFRSDVQFGRGFQTQAKAGNFAVPIEAHRPEKFTEQFRAAPRVGFVKELANVADVDTAAKERSANLKRARGRVRILKRSGIGRNSDEKVFGDG